MTPGEICVACAGCCNYVTVPLAYPRSRAARDLCRWHLLHRNVEIYVDHDKSWHLLFKTPCDKLLPTGRCSIYETRPQICRDYDPSACSRVGKDHVALFRTPEELDAWIEARRRAKPGRTRSS